MRLICRVAEFRIEICRFKKRTRKYRKKSLSLFNTENCRQWITGGLEFNYWIL